MKLFFSLSVVCLIGVAFGGDFNVMDYGAKADGKADNAKAFEATWSAVCKHNGPAKFIVPEGKYWLCPVRFAGPCDNVPTITMQMDGHLLAETNMKKFTADWIYFGWIDGLTITGSGTFDGQGKSAWHLNDCLKKSNKCTLLPNNILFNSMINTVIQGITSTNSKNFNFGVVSCKKFRVQNVKVTSPDDSPNTDGIHVERCSDVTIENSVIGTGDDCISLGPGLTNIFINKVNCGPGHGISIGSLGKYPNELDVNGIVVRDCTISDTTNGARIKTWENTPTPSKVTNITYENIIFKNVLNPIIIDQVYCPHGNCRNASPSKVKISDVTFKNIRGTSASPIAVTLNCSKANPCENIKIQDIDIKPVKGPPVTSYCANVKPIYGGAQVNPRCNAANGY